MKKMFSPKIKFLILFIIAAVCFPCAVQAQKRQKNDLKIEWQFDIADEENSPTGKVYLVVGKREILILPDATERYSVVERKDYQRNEIPSSAKTAIFGWWAGQGKTLYVARRKNRLIVFIKYDDEGDASDSIFKKLKTIDIPRR